MVDAEAQAMARESVARVKAAAHVREVHVDLEHFFDGYADHAEYTLSILDAALDGGADVVVLCDTNGGANGAGGLPDQNGVQAAL